MFPSKSLLDNNEIEFSKTWISKKKNTKFSKSFFIKFLSLIMIIIGTLHTRLI